MRARPEPEIRPEPETRPGPEAPADLPPLGPSAGQVSTRFRALYLAARKLDPAMGGANVGHFHDRLATTARARGQEPMALLEAAFAEWRSGGFQGVEKAAPYSAFVARFDGLVEPPGAVQGDSDRLREQARRALAAGQGDKARRLLSQAKAVEARNAR